MSSHNQLREIARASSGKKVTDLEISLAFSEDRRIQRQRDLDNRFHAEEVAIRYQRSNERLAESIAESNNHIRQEFAQRLAGANWKIAQMRDGLSNLEDRLKQEQKRAERQRKEHARQLQRLREAQERELELKRETSCFVYRACKAVVALRIAQNTAATVTRAKELSVVSAVWSECKKFQQSSMQEWHRERRRQSQDLQGRLQAIQSRILFLGGRVTELNKSMPKPYTGWFDSKRNRITTQREKMQQEIGSAQAELSGLFVERSGVNCAIDDLDTSSSSEEQAHAEHVRLRAAERWLTSDLRGLLEQPEPALQAVVTIDYELARALNDASASEYPGLGAIPTGHQVAQIVATERELRKQNDKGSTQAPDLEAKRALQILWKDLINCPPGEGQALALPGSAAPANAMVRQLGTELGREIMQGLFAKLLD